MITYLIFILFYNIVQNFFHLCIIWKKSKAWHSISAGIDICLYIFFPLMIWKQWLIIRHWTDILWLLGIGLTVRLISRDIMLGVGTTAWMDKHIKGYYRLCLYMFVLFLSVCFIIHYYTF